MKSDSLLHGLSFTSHVSHTETKGQDKVEFECKTKTENETTEMKDKIKFKLSHDNKGLKVKVEYEQETEVDRRRLQGDANIEGTETETSFEVVFGKLVEYEKPGSASRHRRRLTPVEEAYDWESDTVVNELSLADWSGFSTVDVSRRRLQSGEEDTVYQFSLSTYDQVATFDFTIAQAGGANAAVTANKMKIDVRLTDYPWKSTTSNLAIVSNVESEREVKVEYADDDDDDKDKKEEDEEDEKDEMDKEKEDEDEEEDEGGESRRRLVTRETNEVTISFSDALSTTGVMPFGEYTWAKTAEVSSTTDSNSTAPEIAVMQLDSAGITDAATIQVVATTPQGSSEQLAFSFVGGDVAKGASSIYWDPETGINYAPAGSANGAGGSASSMLTGSVALALSAAVAFLL